MVPLTMEWFAVYTGVPFEMMVRRDIIRVAETKVGPNPSFVLRGANMYAGVGECSTRDFGECGVREKAD